MSLPSSSSSLLSWLCCVALLVITSLLLLLFLLLLSVVVMVLSLLLFVVVVMLWWWGLCVSLLRTCRIYSHKSSVHRSLGRPMRRRGVYLGMEFGSHRNAVVIQLSSGIDIILCAHFHFRLRCMVAQSSNLNCFVLASASPWTHVDTY